MAWLAYIEAQYRIAYPDAKPKRSEKHVQVQIKTKDEQEDELPEVDLATEDAEPTVEEAIVEEADSTLEAVADVAVTEASTIVEETAAAIINATDDFGLEPDEEGKVYARNPDPEKEGTRVDFDKYAIIRKAILNTMHKVGGEISFKELTNTLKEQLTDFDGSVNWYTTTVKLDLEARGIIERVPDESPQRLRLID